MLQAAWSVGAHRHWTKPSAVTTTTNPTPGARWERELPHPRGRSHRRWASSTTTIHRRHPRKGRASEHTRSRSIRWCRRRFLLRCLPRWWRPFRSWSENPWFRREFPRSWATEWSSRWFPSKTSSSWRLRWRLRYRTRWARRSPPPKSAITTMASATKKFRRHSRHKRQTESGDSWRRCLRRCRRRMRPAWAKKWRPAVG
mmetsp:Transcript_7634/g.15948  ORF Transcript_7634/g.15948 Transcript_7634/m.15948 type:complete len:200 (-) Transcript_7634:20-619(-)